MKNYEERRGRMTNLQKNIQLLEEYRELEDNWNGYEAKKITDTLIDKCIAIIPTLQIQPEVFPTGRSSIHFEFDHKNGTYLEFELYLEKIDFYADLGDGSVEKTYTYEEIDWNAILTEFLPIEA
jgi:hypothetical protein